MSSNHAEQPSSERLREIAELAEFVAEESWKGAVLDPESIAQAKGITLSFNDYEDGFDGMLECRAGRFHIYGNLARLQRRDSPRARFTVAHELGHYFIDEHRRVLESGAAGGHRSLCDYESRNPAEREADHFAANLLLPERRFRSAASRVAAGLSGVLDLAELFRASVTSTAIRYASLNVKPCAVVRWHDSGVAWKWLSGSTREAGFRVTIEQPAKLPVDCPTARARAKEIPPKRYFESGTTASAWFPRIAPGSPRNVILIEQALSLGRFGVITFLYPEAGQYDFPHWI
jgi:hypothetical protein